MSISVSSRLQSLSLETFRSGFKLEEFFDRLYREVLSESDLEEGSVRSRGANPGNESKDALLKVRKLLEHFRRWGLRSVVRGNWFGGICGVVDDWLCD